jgi:hypothetical protein
VDGIVVLRHNETVAWLVDFHDQFVAEFYALPVETQDALLARVKMLKQFGPALSRPHAGSSKARATPI